MRGFDPAALGSVCRPNPEDLARVVAACESLVHTQFQPLRELGTAGPGGDPAAIVLLAQLDQVDTHLRRLRRQLAGPDESR